MMRLELATEAFIGARKEQQDSAAADGFNDHKGAILILADGLGGHEGGAKASRIVVETFLAAAKKGLFTDPARRQRALRDTLEEANSEIAKGVDPAHGQRGMASTAVIAVVAEGAISWISVGDSHLYIWRKGTLTKLNEDHSQAGLMIRSGQFKASDPEVIAAKSALVSALTGRKLEIVDHPQKDLPLEAGDVLVLASDGLNTISEEEIASIVANGNTMNAKALSVALVNAVKERRADRQDNTTVAISRVLSVPKRSATEQATEMPLVPPRQERTTPTEIAAANQRTQVQPPPKPPVARDASVKTELPTERVTPSQPAGVTVPAPNARTVVPPKPGTAQPARSQPPAADARTAITETPAEVRPSATPPVPQSPPRAAPELKATRPMAPKPAEKPQRSSLPLIGLALLALATILGGLVIARMTGVWDPIGALTATPRTPVQTEPTKTPAKAVPTDRKQEPLDARREPPDAKKAPPPAPKKEEARQPEPAAQPQPGQPAPTDQRPAQGPAAPTPPPLDRATEPPTTPLPDQGRAEPLPSQQPESRPQDQTPPTGQPQPVETTPVPQQRQIRQAPPLPPPPATPKNDRQGALPQPQALPRPDLRPDNLKQPLTEEEWVRQQQELEQQRLRFEEEQEQARRQAQATVCQPHNQRGDRFASRDVCYKFCDDRHPVSRFSRAAAEEAQFLRGRCKTGLCDRVCQ